MRKGLLWMVCVATVAWAQDVPSMVFPELAELRNKVVTEGPVAAAIAARLAEGRAWRREANSVRWPQINSSSEFVHVVEDRADAAKNVTRDRYRMSVDATYPIYHWGAMDARAKVGKQTYQQARAESALRRARVEEELANLYFELLRKTESLALVQVDVDMANKRAAVVSDASATTSSVQKEENTLRMQEMNLSVRTLTQQIGYIKDQIEEICPGAKELKLTVGEFPRSLEVPAEWQQPVAGDTPSELMAKTQLRVGQLRLREKAAADKPLVDLTAGFYQDQVDAVSSTDAVDRNNFYAGVRVNWKLFDGFQTRSATAALRARQRQLEEDYRRQKIAAVRAYRVDRENLQNLCESYTIALGRYQLSQERLVAQNTIAKGGQISPEALQAATRAQVESRLAVIGILADYAKTYSKIEGNRSFSQNP